MIIVILIMIVMIILILLISLNESIRSRIVQIAIVSICLFN